MPGLLRLLCYLGKHEVDNWTYGTDICSKHGECQQCGADIVYTIGHEWGPKRPTTTNERWTTACKRCGEPLLEYTYGPWEDINYVDWEYIKQAWRDNGKKGATGKTLDGTPWEGRDDIKDSPPG